jgi:hypothetical protein
MAGVNNLNLTVKELALTRKFFGRATAIRREKL